MTEQQGTFNQIIGVTVAIALVVIGLFFALLTVERTSLYGVLKALGAKSSTIFAGLVAQAVVVTAIAALVAGTLVVLLDLLLPPGSIPLLITPAPHPPQRRAAARRRRARLFVLPAPRPAHRPRLSDRNLLMTGSTS